MKRRDFLKLAGAGVFSPAITKLFSLKKDATEKLIPYVVPPDGIIPGVDAWFFTVCRQCPAGCSIQVKLREGRAKKIEGNPDFPVNYGKTCARGQAGLQVLYNPDRLREPKERVGTKYVAAGWDSTLRNLSSRLSDIQKQGKAGEVVFLTDTVSGTGAKVISEFMSKFGSEQVYQYELYHDEASLVANELCFGHKKPAYYDIANTSFVLSLGSSFLDTSTSPVLYSVGYGKMRDAGERMEKSRGWLVHFEPRHSLTAAAADEWHPINPETEGFLGMGIAHEIIKKGLHHESVSAELEDWEKALEAFGLERVSEVTGVPVEEIEKIAEEFASHHPAFAIAEGGPTAQKNGVFNAIAANILNHLTGNVDVKGGVRFNERSSGPGITTLTFEGMEELIKKMESGKVQAVFINNVNPAFTLPPETGFKKALDKVPLVVSFSPFVDETNDNARYQLPQHSYLECWGDYLPPLDGGEGSIGVMQPVVAPLHDTRQLEDILMSLAKLLGGEVAAAFPQDNFLDYLKNEWTAVYDAGKKEGSIKDATFTDFWNDLYGKGGMWQKEAAFAASTEKPSSEIVERFEPKEGEDEGDYHLHLYPSHGHYDGRGANLPWLQQMPEPMATLGWGTWVELNPETAEKLHVKEDDVIKIESPAGSIEAPVFVFPAIHPETIAMPIGQGHTNYGRYANGRGVNPLEIVEPQKQKGAGGLAWYSTKVKISKTGKTQRVLKTEPDVYNPGLEHGVRELERHIVQTVSPEKYEEMKEEHELEAIKALPTRDLKKEPHFLDFVGLSKQRKSIWHKYNYRWGMVIDLDKCTGCEACMVACFAENNLPLIDPKRIAARRQHNWLRMDRYWEGEYPEVRAKVVPMNCFQCGNAPCEPVCPVYAAFHNSDGLNGQVYPRCIGTRYCNSNCPYRARYFNWFPPQWDEPLEQQLNPDVTVRMSGVTDKCTFCFQRIRYAKDLAKDEGRSLRDGEVTTACAQACPSGAITFGNLLDEESEVSKLTKNPRRYRILEELNTEPAVVYLKAVRKGEAGEEEGGEGGGH